MNIIKKIFGAKKELPNSKPKDNDNHIDTIESLLSNNPSIIFNQIGIDFQIVLLSQNINNKELADVYASLISEKYGVRTKVGSYFDKTSYQIWLYRINLDKISEFYVEQLDAWIFSYENLIKMKSFDYEKSIESTSIGQVINTYLSYKLNSETSKFTLLFENSYYKYYQYYSGTLLRHDKETERTFIVGKFINIVDCAQYHNKLYIAEHSGIIGDREIYQCDLNGSNLIKLQCLNNEKIFKAGHFVSIDSPQKLNINNDSLEIIVKGDNGNIKYDYKIIITESNGEIHIYKTT